MTPLITRTIALFFAAAMLISNPARADIAVVVHKDNPLSTITMKEGQRIFLGVTKKLPDGRSIKIVEQEDNFKLKENFYMELTGSSVCRSSQQSLGWIGFFRASHSTGESQR